MKVWTVACQGCPLVLVGQPLANAADPETTGHAAILAASHLGTYPDHTLAWSYEMADDHAERMAADQAEHQANLARSADLDRQRLAEIRAKHEADDAAARAALKSSGKRVARDTLLIEPAPGSLGSR